MRAARLLASLAALGIVLSATTASARILRFPETGHPAFLTEVPDDWTSRTDSTGNLIISSANHALAFSLHILVDSRTPDMIARRAMEIQKVTPTPAKQEASISGFKGVAYEWQATNAAHVKLDVTLTVVEIDATHVANCSVALADSSSADTHRIAQSFVQNLKIVQPLP